MTIGRDKLAPLTIPLVRRCIHQIFPAIKADANEMLVTLGLGDRKVC
jgi:hypothetical protein